MKFATFPLVLDTPGVLYASESVLTEGATVAAFAEVSLRPSVAGRRARLGDLNQHDGRAARAVYP
jgi:hypothetical protein